ncbi:MAG: hypothetical protein AUH29_13480 [Candidatus Rokubacteria bacterium 13_1_40CM_69_27]|nr:MAG: hypothetical protein AUH29_13480 [Candidatus Rokubacteria bacterium 13_1_40CM_69_27]OLE39581.1 MAG: hypothetical protein AUG00_01685 [Candidatus Rokubacteria bacterium 13_1_20CM_2_70_7]
MDLHETKDRVAVALVESIFRRARYRVRPFDADGTKPRFVREDFAPSFFVFVPGPEGAEREFLIDVTYRPFVEQFIALENKRRDSSIFVLARRHWPALHFVLVTDHPGAGRSCFQAVTLGERGAEVRLRTVDLVDLAEFGVFPHNVADHEELLLRIFAMLSADRHRREQPHAG